MSLFASTPRILVVDDERLNINTIHAIVRDHYRVMAATSGVQALAAVESNRPDLILLDVNMPGMSGYEVCERLKSDPKTQAIPIIFVTASEDAEDESRGFALGAADYLTKPVRPSVLLARIRTQLALADQARALDALVQERTSELARAQEALREAMHNLRVTEIAAGVYWLQVPEANLRILCGCPAEVVKHMMRRGFVLPEKQGNVMSETGPNAILLSATLLQHGTICNAAEFPVLQMLYRQGMLIPGHPNNTGVKPLLIGIQPQVQAQLAYIHRGNYGLLSEEELQAAGASAEEADLWMRIKRRFAFGHIRSPEDFLDSVVVPQDGSPTQIRGGVAVAYVAPNVFRFSFRDKTVDIDLSVKKTPRLVAPYTLDFHSVPRERFAVLHSGEGDGWDVQRPSMSSVLMWNGKIYLVDAPPNIADILQRLGIDTNEVEGVFHTHGHDDHFLGLLTLTQTDRRIKYFAAPTVRAAVAKKLAALLGSDDGVLDALFDVALLQPGQWNDCDGLEVLPSYSPHPVENTIFVFRGCDDEGTTRTYAHWADLAPFSLLDTMTGTQPDQVPLSFMESVKQSYLLPVDLKKLDIGGGMIHGRAEDFKTDTSMRLTLAHVARALTDTEKEIGAAAPFGALDVLVPSRRDHLRDLADRTVREVFAELAEPMQRLFREAPVVEVNPGTILRKHGQSLSHVELVLTGVVEQLQASEGVRREFAVGSLLTEESLLETGLATGTWRALSHVRLLRVPLVRFRALLGLHDPQGELQALFRRGKTLRDNWLTWDRLGVSAIRRLLSAQQEERRVVGQTCEVDGKLVFVSEGVLQQGDRELAAGAWLGCGSHEGCWVAKTEVVLRVLPTSVVREIPVLQWRLQEYAAQHVVSRSRCEMLPITP